MRKYILALPVLTIIFLTVIIGCSSHNSKPITAPAIPDTQSKIDIPTIDSEADYIGHELLGAWNMTIDPEKMTATIEPNREMLVHWNVKSMIPTPGIKINSFDPGTWTIDCDVTLRNPYAITGYDVRLIIFTTDAGRTLNNHDNWTPLYDISGGDSINPFKAYAKEQPLRVFAGPVSYTENLVINLGGNFNVQFAVDASYPSNCEEPYMIGNMIQEEPLYDRLYDTCPAFVYAYRWNTEKWMRVFVECPEVMDEPLEMDTTDMEYFYGNIMNFQDAPAGEYPALISAHTENPIPLYSFDTIYITEKPIYGWAKGFPNDDYCPGVETDLSGNIYIGLNSTNRVVSYTKDPTERWQKDLNSVGDFEQIHDISLNQYYSYVYATAYAYYCGTSGFSGMSATRSNKDSGSTTSGYHCFTLPVGPHQVEADINGNAYTTGIWDNNHGNHAIMWKCNSSIVGQWYNIWGNDDDGGMEFTDLEISSSGTVYGSGEFWGTSIDFDPTDGGVLTYTPTGAHDAFISEWNTDGSRVRSTRWGGYNDDNAYTYINVIGQNDNHDVLVAGTYSGTVDFNPYLMIADEHTSVGYSGDMYISKFSDTFSYQGSFRISGAGSATPTGIAFDMYENIYVCGYFEYGTVDFDPGRNTVNRTPVGEDDMFIAKYTNDFEFVWVQTWGTSSYEHANDIAYDRTYNYIYVVGGYYGTMDFDPGEGVYEMTSTDGFDPFLMRLLNNGTWEY